MNIKVGQTLAKGIEKGEEASEKTKEAAGNVAGTTKVKADEASEITKQKANQARFHFVVNYPFTNDLSRPLREQKRLRRTSRRM